MSIIVIWPGISPILVIGFAAIFLGVCIIGIWLDVFLERQGVIKDGGNFGGTVIVLAMFLLPVLGAYYIVNQEEKEHWQEVVQKRQALQSDRNVDIQVEQSYGQEKCPPLPFVEDAIKFCEALKDKCKHLHST